jgi:hypothetical protein
MTRPKANPIRRMATRISAHDTPVTDRRHDPRATLGPCPRRADPARIDGAREAATRNRVTGERVMEATADAWIAAREEQAARDGIERGSAFWDAGWAWIAEQRRRRAPVGPRR